MKFVKIILLLKIKLFDELEITLPVLGKSYRIVLDNNIRLSGVGFVTSSEIYRLGKKYPVKRVPQLIRNFHSKDQEKLISFVFSQQIEQRKKGII